MAAVAVFAELKFRDGLRENVSVNVENNLPSLIRGIHELNENVSRLLSELVEREKTLGDCAEGEGEGVEEDEEEESDEDKGPEDPQNSDLQPPAKRSKT